MEQIPIDSVVLSKTNSQVARRRQFDKGRLAELAESITKHGVLQAIIVRPGKKSAYELIAGERRVLAAKIANLTEIPAVVKRDISDGDVIEIQLIENLQREDVHPMQEAEGYQELLQKHGHAIEQLHQRVGKSRSYVYGRIKLLALCAKARKAFHEDKISASIALLIARVPDDGLQRKALEAMTDSSGRTVSYRRAKEIITEQFMLRLRGAPFPVKDADLVKAAGACGECPKRTGNQPELFGDIKGADVCTDPKCFARKAKKHGNRVIAAAKKDGRKVLTGADAKKVAPYDHNDSYLRGYVKANEKNYGDHATSGSKCRTNRKIIDGSVEPTLLQMPGSGIVIEVYRGADVDNILKKNKPKTRQDDGTAARRRKAANEKRFRRALFDKVRPGLPRPTMKVVAARMVDDLDHDSLKNLCEIRDFEVPVLNRYGSKQKDYRAFEKTIDGMTEREATELVNDCLYVRDLQVPTWSDSTPEGLLAAAKEQKVNVAAIRRATTKKKANKKSRKKVAKKKAKKATRNKGTKKKSKKATRKKAGRKS